MIKQKWLNTLSNIDECKKVSTEFKLNFKSNFNKLTEKERDIFEMIYPNCGVLMLQGVPGASKSAILNTIAEKMGMLFIDLRLSQIEETDIGLFPDKTEIDGHKFIQHLPPIWAHYANLVPTLIAFEELNRCPKYVRNASMQLFAERAIGYNFAFNDNVFMVATGNLGKADKTDVEILDAAQFGRIIPYAYNLSVEEWIEGFAEGRILSCILKYLTSNPSKLFQESNKEGDKEASPRSWTQLSEFLMKNYGEVDENGIITKEPSLEFIIDKVQKKGRNYIGTAPALNFIRFLQEEMVFTLKDILENPQKIKNEIKSITRDRCSSLLNELSSAELYPTLSQKNIQNIVFFLRQLDKNMEDELAGYIHKLIKISSKSTKNIYDILEEFKDIVDYIKNKSNEYHKKVFTT